MRKIICKIIRRSTKIYGRLVAVQLNLNCTIKTKEHIWRIE